MSNSKITRIISPKVFGQIKEKVRKLKRSQNIKLHQAQEIFEGKTEYFTNEDLEEFTMMAEMELVFYAYNGKINLNDKMGSIYSVIDCLGGDTPKHMWFNGEYIDMNSLLENNEEVKVRCSQIYNTYRQMFVGDEEMIFIHPGS